MTDIDELMQKLFTVDGTQPVELDDLDRINVIEYGGGKDAYGGIISGQDVGEFKKKLKKYLES